MRDIVVNDEKCQKKANKIHPETNNIIFFIYGTHTITLASGIDVGQGINVMPGKFGKKNNHRVLNKHVLCNK